MSEIRVEHFGKLVFVITSRILKILIEHKVIKNRLCSKLQIDSIRTIRILNILEVITKTSFSKIAKCATLPEIGPLMASVMVFILFVEISHSRISP